MTSKKLDDFLDQCKELDRYLYARKSKFNVISLDCVIRTLEKIKGEIGNDDYVYCVHYRTEMEKRR